MSISWKCCVTGSIRLYSSHTSGKRYAGPMDGMAHPPVRRGEEVRKADDEAGEEDVRVRPVEGGKDAPEDGEQEHRRRVAEEEVLVEIPQLGVEEARVEHRHGELDPAVGVHHEHGEDDEAQRVREPTGGEDAAQIRARLAALRRDGEADGDADERFAREGVPGEEQRLPERRDDVEAAVDRDRGDDGEVDQREQLEEVRPPVDAVLAHCHMRPQCAGAGAVSPGRKYSATAMIA